MRKAIFVSSLCLAALAVQAGSASFARAAAVPSFDPYVECVREVSIDARQAYERAGTWRARGGGARAMHCEALALHAMGEYATAAKLLQRIAGMDEMSEPERRADLYDQAGQSWLLSGRYEEASEAFALGLEHVSLASASSSAATLTIGLAQAAELSGDRKEAIARLGLVLEALPQHTDALLMRASLHRANRTFDLAMGDLVNYLTLLPGDPEGLLERGHLRLDVADTGGARKDFERVLEEAPDSPSAARARTALANLDFRDELRGQVSAD